MSPFTGEIGQRRFRAVIVALILWAGAEISLGVTGYGGISGNGQLALATIMIAYFGGDAVSKTAREKYSAKIPDGS